MAAPIILSTGATSGAGTAGKGRNDLVAGEVVTLSDTNPLNVEASYVWSFEDIPDGSSATLTGATTATPTFTADVTGSYWVKCVVNSVQTARVIIAVPLAVTGARIPAFGERSGDYVETGERGWHSALTSFMRQADAGAGTAPDFLHAGISGDLVNPLDGTAMAFDTVVRQRGTLTVNGSGRFSGLKSGRTYFIEAGIGMVDTGSSSISFEWYDVTGAAALSFTYSFAISVATNSFTFAPGIATTVFTPGADTELELRVVVNTGACTVRSDVSYARIIEIK